MNPSSPDDDRLDAWLRQPGAPLADGGFSARVMAALPPRRPERFPWQRFLIPVAAAVAGLAIVAASGELEIGLNPLLAALGEFTHGSSAVSLGAGVPFVAGAVLTCLALLQALDETVED